MENRAKGPNHKNHEKIQKPDSAKQFTAVAWCLSHGHVLKIRALSLHTLVSKRAETNYP